MFILLTVVCFVYVQLTITSVQSSIPCTTAQALQSLNLIIAAITNDSSWKDCSLQVSALAPVSLSVILTTAH